MKDWTLGAAKEIAEYARMTDNVRHVVHVSEIIAKHHEQITKPEPGHICDWAAKAGAYLHAEGVRLSSHRIAAVVAHFAEPLVKLLGEARREHAIKPPCPAIDDEDEDCVCGADEWNKRIDEVLNGE